MDIFSFPVVHTMPLRFSHMCKCTCAEEEEEEEGGIELESVTNTESRSLFIPLYPPCFFSYLLLAVLAETIFSFFLLLHLLLTVVRWLDENTQKSATLLARKGGLRDGWMDGWIKP